MRKYNTYIKQLNEKFNLGIFTNEHKGFIDLARRLDIFYKRSGAGGGDLGLVITNNENKLAQFLKNVSDKNYQTIDLI